MTDETKKVLDVKGISTALTGTAKKLFEVMAKSEDSSEYLLNNYESNEEIVDYIIRLDASNQEALAAVKEANAAGFTAVEIDAQDEEDENFIFSKNIIPGMAIGPVEYLGTMPLASTEFKENWKEVVVNGRTLYVSMKHKFRRKDGSEFFIFNAPMMNNVLRILPTKESPLSRTRFGVHANPRVLIQYDGKVDRDTAKEKYGFIFTQGKTTHAVRVTVLDRSFDSLLATTRFEGGQVNWLKKPFDVKEASTGGVDSVHSAWEQAVAAEQARAAASQGGGAEAQMQ